MVEVLEPRVLYSADSVASLLPLLLPDELDTPDTLATSILFDAQGEIDENDLLPQPVTDTDSVKHVVFIDSAVPEFEALRKSAANESTTVVMVAADANGVSFITQTLENYSSLDSVQIISHGASGQLFLGNQTVDEQFLVQEQSALSRWSNALSDGGDILLLGCDVGAAEEGRSFLDKLALLTGADVAASDDLTGHAKLNADWDLEISSGTIEAMVQLDSSIKSNWSHTLGDIDVDTTIDKFDPNILDTWGIGDLLDHRSNQSNGFDEISLREALYVVQKDTNPTDIDRILLPAGEYDLTLDVVAIDGKWGDLNVSADTIIKGEDNPATPTIIKQTIANQRILTVSSGTLQLENVTIADADTSLAAGGGAIYSAESVLITDSILLNNSSSQNGGAVATVGDLTLLRTQVLNNSSEEFGGALYAEGELTIAQSTLVGNSSRDDGGAVYANGGTLTISDSGFTGNFTDTDPNDLSGMIGNGGAVAGSADITIVKSSFDNNETRNVNLLSTGGAVHHEVSGEVRISDVTFSANSSVSGGALYTDQTGNVSNATFVDNIAIINGAAIQSDGTMVNVGGSLFSGNDFITPAAAGSSHIVSGPQFELAGNITSDGFNLYDFDPTPVTALGVGDLVNTNASSVAAQLAPLTELDGSYVKVHALNEGSQAINAGRVPSSGAEDSQGKIRDQVADIGASEHNSASSIVYWADAAGGIFRSDVDFSNVQQIVFGATDPDSIVVDEGASKIYWLTNGNGNTSIDLVSASLDGVGVETTLLSGLVAASSLALNPNTGHLYVAFAGNTQANPSRIDRYELQDLLAAPVTVVANNASNITSIDQNEIIVNPVEMVFNSTSDQLYWTEQGGGNVAPSIRMSDVPSNAIATVSVVATETSNSVALNPEGTSAFWVDTAADSIAEFELDSSTLTQTPVPVADTNPSGIAYAKTEDLLVWTSDAASSISSLNAEDKTAHARYEHDSVISDVATMRTTTVTAVPIITTNSGMTALEGSASVLPEVKLDATDQDTDDDEIVYTVTQTPLHGFLTLSGVPTSSFTQADLEADIVKYVHDGTEMQTDQVEFQLSDGINSSDRFRYDIQIDPVNDAPTLLAGTDGFGAPIKMPLQEGGTYVLNPTILVGFDAESAPAALVYHLTSTVSAGSFTVNGIEATSFTGAQLVAGQVEFEHDGSDNAPENLQLHLDDGSANNAKSGTVNLEFDYVPVNDLPVLTTTATTVFENGNVQITNQNLLISDPDLGFGNIVYNLSELPAHGTIEILERGPLLSTAATFTQVELDSGLVFYTPNVNNADDVIYQLVFVATDPEGASSVPVPMDIIVTGVNNTPTLTTLPLTIEEGSQVILNGANFVVNDPDSSSQDWVLSFSKADEINGSISIYNESSDQANDGYRYFSYRDLLIGNVTYNHDGSEADSVEINFRISDGFTTAAEVALQISVTPINDIPSLRISNNTITVEEGDQYVFQSTDFSFTDADAVFSDMRIYFGASDEGVGTLTVAGATANSFTLSDLAEGQVVYTHDGSEPDVTGTIDSFTFRMGDGQAQSSPVTLNIGIESKNDFPEFTFEPTRDPIPENTPGQVVGEIHYTDSDTDDLVEFSVSDDRFVLTPIVGENTVQVALAENESLDFEEDTAVDSGNMQLEITAIDTNLNAGRPAGYQGVQQEVDLPIEDIEYAPVVDLELIPTQTTGSDFVFNSEWVTDQGNDVGEWLVTATLDGGGDLPPWLAFNSDDRIFEVNRELLELEPPEFTTINVVFSVSSAFGSDVTTPITLFFGEPPEIEAAEPVEVPVEVEQEVEVIVQPEPVAVIIEPPPDFAALIEVPTVVSEQLEATNDSSTNGNSTSPGEEEILNDESDEKVDLHDLIKPLASIGNLQLAVVDNAMGYQSGNSSGSQSIQEMDKRDLNDIFSAAQSQLEAQSALMANAMDNKEVLNDDSSAVSRALFGTSTGLSTGLSVGYLLWLVRGGTLMGSVLSSLPAWRFVDPLPVLGSLADDMENDEESLESIVESDGKGAVDVQVEATPTLGARIANVFGWKR